MITHNIPNPLVDFDIFDHDPPGHGVLNIMMIELADLKRIARLFGVGLSRIDNHQTAEHFYTCQLPVKRGYLRAYTRNYKGVRPSVDPSLTAEPKS